MLWGRVSSIRPKGDFGWLKGEITEFNGEWLSPTIFGHNEL